MDKKYLKDYTKYILEHKYNVKKAFDWLLNNLADEINFGDIDKVKNLIDQHDLSKWSVEEFEPYALYFNVDKNKYKEDFDKAWNHHQKCNPHHWQYWVLVNDEEGTKALDMPQEYIIEMICDWWSFSHKQNKLAEIFSWYEKQKSNQILSDKTKKEVEFILSKIKEKV